MRLVNGKSEKKPATGAQQETDLGLHLSVDGRLRADGAGRGAGRDCPGGVGSPLAVKELSPGTSCNDV